MSYYKSSLKNIKSNVAKS